MRGAADDQFVECADGCSVYPCAIAALAVASNGQFDQLFDEAALQEALAATQIANTRSSNLPVSSMLISVL